MNEPSSNALHWDSYPAMAGDEKSGVSLADYFGILRRRVWYLLLPSVVIFAIVAAVAFSLAPVYRSSATILIEQQQIPSDLVRSTVTSYADQRVQVISQRVMTTANLSSIVEKFDLYKAERKSKTLPSIAAEMREDVHLEMVSAQVIDPRSGAAKRATIAFTLAYESESPRLAQRVTNEMVSLFLDENLRKRREAAEETSTFLATEAEKLAEQIADQEAQITAFKEANGDALPGMQTINSNILQRTESELSRNKLESRLLEQRVAYLQRELARSSRWGEDYQDVNNRILTPRERLLQLEVQYVTLSSQYQDGHPDLEIVKREIAALQQLTGVTSPTDLEKLLAAARADLQAIEADFPPDHPDVKANRRMVESIEKRLAAARIAPVTETSAAERPEDASYAQLESSLKSARAEYQYLKERRGKLMQDLETYEARLAKGPKIESEFRTLTRDYDNSVKKYQEVKAKQLEAELAQSLESDRLAERFVLIEPPIVPPKPFKPNRIAILLLGAVFSLAGGVAVIILLEKLDDSVYDAQGIAKATGLSPLAAIPLLLTAEQNRRRRRRRLLVAGVVLGLAIVAIAALHFFIVPLDVAYLRAIEKADSLMI